MIETGQQLAIDPAEVRGLLDRQAITEQIYRYCRAVDRLDIPLGHSVFHEDGTADYGESLHRGGGRGVIDFICASHLPTLGHSHQVCNSIVALDGDRAGSETYFQSATRLMQDTPRSCRSGFGGVTSTSGRGGMASGASTNV
jgi:SnoaL-like domain